MISTKTRPKTIDEYIQTAPKEAQKKLREMCACIRAAAPEATEGLKWGMPAFSYRRILVTFAAFKNHIGRLSDIVGRDRLRERSFKVFHGQGFDPVSLGEAAASVSGPQDHRFSR
jgi:hypothetical protein